MESQSRQHDPPAVDSTASIPTSVLVAVVEVAARAGWPTDEWLGAAGLNRQSINAADARASFAQAVAVLRRAVVAFPDHGLGFDVGARDMFVSLGVLGLAIRSADTLEAAFDVGAELHQTSGSLMDVQIECGPGFVSLRTDERRPHPEILPFLTEELFASTLVTVRSVLEDPQQSPAFVELTYPVTTYPQRYREFFNCPVRFDADKNRLAFTDAVMQRPLPRRDPATHAVAVDACRAMITNRRDLDDIVYRVEQIVTDTLRTPLTMAQVAAHLNMTERTLHRRLRNRSERFGALRDRIRHERARALIRDTGMPLHAVAAEVGFTDPREFRRAYVKWTGYPPSLERAVGEHGQQPVQTGTIEGGSARSHGAPTPPSVQRLS